jgi:hopanoid biosynthesis associated RND transporter like protein HpnN
MLASAVTATVRFCIRFPWRIIVLGLCLGAVAAAYTVSHFAINTDIVRLISSNLDWRQRELAFDREFPGHFGTTMIVIDAPTTEFVSAATAALAENLAVRKDLFRAVNNLTGSEFFAKNGLLFQPAARLEGMVRGLGVAAPLIGVLASDLSLRGLTRATQMTLIGVSQERVSLNALAPTYTKAAIAVENLLAGRPAVFSWQELLTGKPPQPSELRRFIEVKPILDYAALEPGWKSSAAIRKAATDLELASRYQARVRLTGLVPMGDEEFATVREGAMVNAIGTVMVVLTILWLALKSARIIFAVFVNLFVGLAITAALGLMMLGALNMISVAFAVLFVGIGVDFGIQFSVRYRAERHESKDLGSAIVDAARHVGVPFTVAAAAVACGFLSFMPTSYRGIAELGQIAGVGMLIAYVTSITFLPALLTALKPPGEPEPVGYRFLAPVDRFMQNYRVPVVVGTILVCLAGLPLLYSLNFDIDPIHLRSTKVESVATFLDLRDAPRVGINSISVISPTLAKANEAADRLRELPQVSQVTTLQSLLPDDQDKKLALIQELKEKLGQRLNPQNPAEPPSDADNVAALNATAGQLSQAATSATGAGADAAKRLAAALTHLAKADKPLRDKAQAVFIVPLRVDLAEMSNFLKAQRITVDKIPPFIKSQWVNAVGQARVEVAPKGDINNSEFMRSFARSVLAVYPDAVGGPISTLHAGDAVIAAFIQAGIYALLSIAILLWIVLRRFGDVLLTLVPLLLAGAVTLEICVLIGLPLNFANIIALPLLLGVGVAFKIYYIMAWRAGQTDLLQSSLTRAVIWSASTTATAFGSLWLSSHPGTSSMGKLMALSLVCTLAAAVLFQPALMGAPRTSDNQTEK